MMKYKRPTWEMYLYWPANLVNCNIEQAPSETLTDGMSLRLAIATIGHIGVLSVRMETASK